MIIKFTKMQALGNDFIIIDLVTQRLLLNREQIRRLADRNFGIGCDQVLLVEPPLASNHDFHYRIYNADGTEIEQCGNGARCFATFVRDQQLSDKKELTIGTKKSTLKLKLLDNDDVEVNMGKPIFDPQNIPFKTPFPDKSYNIKVNNTSLQAFVLSMGNPHCVINVPNITKAKVSEHGSILSSHSRFPEGANISFMEIISSEAINLRTYERGVGETLACGSAACAAVVAGIKQEKLTNEVEVNLPHGKLSINWQDHDAPVIMTGPTFATFQGRFRV